MEMIFLWRARVKGKNQHIFSRFIHFRFGFLFSMLPFWFTFSRHLFAYLISFYLFCSFIYYVSFALFSWRWWWWWCFALSVPRRARRVVVVVMVTTSKTRCGAFSCGWIFFRVLAVGNACVFKFDVFGLCFDPSRFVLMDQINSAGDIADYGDFM